MPSSGWDTFVGRAAELDVLNAGLTRAESGNGSIVVIAGEPGIGKSSLIDHFATRARKRNACVVWGRCWEAGGAPAYWPFAQVIRTIVRDSDVETLRALTAVGASEIAHIVPEVREALGEVAEPSAADPDTARFRLFDAVVCFLRAAAAREPALIVALDDMHAADTPSLLLLQFLARELLDARIVLVVSYRSTEVTAEHALTSTLAELSRVPNTRRVRLQGLASGEISEYLARVTGEDVDPAVIDALEARTDGNPLFVSEIIRLMLGDTTLLGTSVQMPDEVPTGVQEAIARRVARLPQSCRAALDTAAILGRDVPLDVLRALTDIGSEELLDALDEAVGAGILSRGHSAIGVLRFSHVLVRDALYERLPTAHRARSHLRAAEVIERLRADDLEPHLSEIAHHYMAAGPVGDPAMAARYTGLAGQSALRRLAYEEAIRLLRAALELTERAHARDDTHLNFLLDLGDAEACAGDLPGAQATFRDASSLARRLERPDALARAALGYGGRFTLRRAGADTTLIVLLEDALEAVGPADSLRRVQLLSRLACARRSDADATQRRDEAAEAVSMARRLDDPRALARALGGYHGAIWCADSASERLEVAAEMLDCAVRADDAEEMIEAYIARWVARWELGDLSGTRADIAAMTPIAALLRQPAHRWLVAISHGAIALFEGRFHEVEQLAVTGRSEGRGSLDFDGDAACLTQLSLLRLEQGRADELLDELERGADAYPWYPHLRALLARLCAADGQLGRARSIVESLAPFNYALLPTSGTYSMFSLSVLADVVGELRDVALAQPLLERLRPYGRQNAMAPPEACAGWIARPLAVLCGVLGNVGEAERYFEEAIRAHLEMGARAWLAHSHYDYACMLRENGATIEDARVQEQLGHAAAIARDLGMTDLAARTSSSSIVHDQHDDECVFRREGEYWTIAFSGRAVRMRHSKGLVHLAALLARPNHDVTAVDLAALGDGAVSVSEKAVHTAARGSAEILDPRARDGYRRRIVELQAEIDEAEEWSDIERASRARDELDFLVHELAAATGLGGRDRTFGSSAERARQRVKKAIAAGLARIDAEHPNLGRHLASTVRTGYVCRYEPDPRAPITWRT